MTITQVTFRRVYNLGNYETMHVELSASVDAAAGDTTQDTLRKLAEEAAVYRAQQGLARQKGGAP